MQNCINQSHFPNNADIQRFIKLFQSTLLCLRSENLLTLPVDVLLHFPFDNGKIGFKKKPSKTKGSSSPIDWKELKKMKN
jgi:hypothetical protein